MVTQRWGWGGARRPRPAAHSESERGVGSVGWEGCWDGWVGAWLSPWGAGAGLLPGPAVAPPPSLLAAACRPHIAAIVTIVHPPRPLPVQGGKEAARSNALLHRLIVDAVAEVAPGVGRDLVGLVTSRDEIDELLKLHDVIDLVIPRGSNQLVSCVLWVGSTSLCRPAAWRLRSWHPPRSCSCTLLSTPRCMPFLPSLLPSSSIPPHTPSSSSSSTAALSLHVHLGGWSSGQASCIQQHTPSAPGAGPHTPTPTHPPLSPNQPPNPLACAGQLTPLPHIPTTTTTAHLRRSTTSSSTPRSRCWAMPMESATSTWTPPLTWTRPHASAWMPRWAEVAGSARVALVSG